VAYVKNVEHSLVRDRSPSKEKSFSQATSRVLFFNDALLESREREVLMPNDPEVPNIPDPEPAVVQSPLEGDGELKAMQVIVTALKPLTDEERRRVLEYVLGRFGALPIQSAIPSLSTVGMPAGGASGSSSHHSISTSSIHDMRSLKEVKAPKTANEMAALVAYYVSELAPTADRKNEITKADIERYFKSAGFNLPADAGFTLVNAKNAGYLDSAGSGQYKLNPVGYNLVAHRMGTRDDKEPRRPRAKKAIRRAAKKTARRVKK
jgi:hypothetical protein